MSASADDSSVSPIGPVGSDPVDAVESRTAAPVAGSPSAPPTGRTPASGAPTDLALSPGVASEELEHPIALPRGIDARAAVHDSAVHGSSIASAIEAAAGRTADVNDREQQLGGAAASAAAGQATPRPDGPDVEDGDDPADPLAPVTAIEAESHRRDQRRKQEEPDADLHP